MAIFAYSVGARTNRDNAVRASAYIARDCYEDRRTGWVHDESRQPHREKSQQEVKFSGLYAPAGAPAWCRGEENIEQFWNAAIAAERRKDAQIAERVIIALPHEFTDKQARWALQDHVREFTRQGRVVQVAIHSPEPGHDERNLHAHLMVSLRGVDENGFKASKAQEQQERFMNRSAYVEQLRENWAHVANRHLERHGHEASLDHRSYQRQGIDRAPQVHLGPGDAQRERNGERSQVIDFNAAVRERNAQRARGPELDPDSSPPAPGAPGQRKERAMSETRELEMSPQIRDLWARKIDDNYKALAQRTDSLANLAQRNARETSILTIEGGRLDEQLEKRRNGQDHPQQGSSWLGRIFADAGNAIAADIRNALHDRGIITDKVQNALETRLESIHERLGVIKDAQPGLQRDLGELRESRAAMLEALGPRIDTAAREQRERVGPELQRDRGMDLGR